MDTWQFYQNENGAWCWKHVAGDGFVEKSESCFHSRTDCIADAMRHGYLAQGSPRCRSDPPWSSVCMRSQP